MLFRNKDLAGIRAGTIRLVFRKWKKPTVKAGGRLRTAAGELEILAVTRIAISDISKEDARAAGALSREALLAELDKRSEGDLYRIELGMLHPDSRLTLRDKLPDETDLQTLKTKLGRMDSRAEIAWTIRVLEVLRDNPGLRAGDLCRLVKLEKSVFKSNVRKLKNLGLTISLGTGYKLSPRGEALLSRTLGPEK